MSSLERIDSGILDELVDVQEGELNNPQVPCPASGDPRLKQISYSSSLLLHGCLRKYQLSKLGANRKVNDINTQLTFDFGHALGEAVVDLMCGKSRTDVIFKMMMDWPSHFFAENDKQKKSLFHAIYAVDMFLSARAEGLLEDYELVYLPDGRPAAEVSFKLHLPNGYIERGYIDMILRNKYTKEYCIFDNKTSSARYINPGSYQNSAQALGYSVVLDKIDPGRVSVNYTVYYLVWMTFLERWEQFEFPKTAVQRAQWIQAKLWDVETIERAREFEGDYGIWPIMGENCMSYGRPCNWLGECHMPTESLIQPLRESDIADETMDRFGKPWDVVMDFQELIGEDGSDG